jgi:hypothetical protein
MGNSSSVTVAPRLIIVVTSACQASDVRPATWVTRVAM